MVRLMVLGPALLVAAIATTVGPAPSPPRPAKAPKASVDLPAPSSAPAPSSDPAAVRTRGQRPHPGDLRNPFIAPPPKSGPPTLVRERDLKDPFAPRPQAQLSPRAVEAELIDPFVRPPSPRTKATPDASCTTDGVPVQRPRALGPAKVRCPEPTRTPQQQRSVQPPPPPSPEPRRTIRRD
jgi:hypothetical protein